MVDPEPMDVYEAEAPKSMAAVVLQVSQLSIITVPNQKDVQVQLMSQEQGRRQNIGVSLWVSTGIKLQETQ